MTAILERLCFGHRRLWLVLWIVTTILAALAASRLTIDASFAKQVPLEHPYIKTLLKYESVASKTVRERPLVMVAHLDHPGFWIQKVSTRSVELKFQGGVGAGHAKPGMGVRFFALGLVQLIIVSFTDNLDFHRPIRRTYFFHATRSEIDTTLGKNRMHNTAGAR